MKRLTLLLLLLSLNLIYAKSIIIGTYSTKQNAQVQLKQVLETTKTLPVMMALQEDEGFDYHVRPLAQYFVVAIEPFTHDTALFNALEETRKTFPDAYIHVPTVRLPEPSTREEVVIENSDLIAPQETISQEEVATPQEIIDPVEEVAPEPETSEIYVSEEDAALNAVVDEAITSDVETQEPDLETDSKHANEVVAVEVVNNKKPAIAPKKEPSYLQILATLPQEYFMIGGGVIALLLLLLIFKKRSSVKKEQRGLPDLEIEHEDVPSEEVTDDFNTDLLEPTSEASAVIEDEFELSSEDEAALDKELDAFDSNLDDFDNFDELDSFDDVAEDIAASETPVVAQNSRKKRDPKNTHGEIHKDDFKDFEGLRVLVAEDNMINQKVLKGMLNESGMDIVMAENGQEALDILEKDANFALVLMDAHMPVMDGYDATRAIRADARFEDIAVVALTGDVASDDIRKLYDCGMEGHLEKPIHMGALYDVFYTYSEDDTPNENVEVSPEEDDIEIDIDTEEIVPSEVSAGMMSLHTADGLSAAGGDNELYLEILHEFIEMYKNADTLVKKYIDENRVNEATALLLDIKGLAGSIGGIDLETVSEELRSALLREDMFAAQDLQHRFHRELHMVLDDIAEYQTK